ncbi:hypothetical protein Hanom_Chr12g01140581 [Helianthus anomalus]
MPAQVKFWVSSFKVNSASCSHSTPFTDHLHSSSFFVYITNNHVFILHISYK